MQCQQSLSVFMQQQYKFLCALLLWVIWQCDGSCHNWDLFVLHFIFTQEYAMDWNSLSCNHQKSDDYSSSFQIYSWFSRGEAHIDKKIYWWYAVIWSWNRTMRQCLGSPCAVLHPVLKTWDTGWKNGKLSRSGHCHLGNWAILMFLNTDVGFLGFLKLLLGYYWSWRGNIPRK